VPARDLTHPVSVRPEVDEPCRGRAQGNGRNGEAECTWIGSPRRKEVDQRNQQLRETSSAREENCLTADAMFRR
jgi:hypothetical protein